MGPHAPAKAQNSWKAVSLTSSGGGLDCGQILQGQWKFFPPTSTPKSPGRMWHGGQEPRPRSIAPWHQSQYCYSYAE